MTEEITSLLQTPAGRRWALIFAGVTEIICWGVVALTTIYGKPGNTLHESAQSWAFAMIGVVLAGLGFGAAMQIVTGMKK